MRDPVDRYRLFYEVIARIPPGRVATYGQVAALAGLAGHARQVGYSLHALPEGSDLPWQRVINAQGEVSPRAESAWGADREGYQRHLLEEEGVEFDARGRVDLERFRWDPDEPADAVSPEPVALDVASWKRRQHFDLFRGYENPFFNLCAEIDVTALVRACEAAGGPRLSLANFYLSLRAANEIEEFRYRLRGDGVVVHPVIHGGSTVLRPDDTFVFAYFEYVADFARFHAQAARSLAEARSGPPDLRPQTASDNLIHYSVIPWVSFTSFAHARSPDPANSVPKIVFGKHYGAGRRRRMPVSVEVHHALMDGLHVGRFLARFQELADRPPALS